MRAATAWRIWGGACMSFGLLASGRTDAAFDTRLKLWDFAPFRPIIEGAGGRMTAWDGGDAQQGGAILACGDPKLHAQLVERLQHLA